MKRNLLTIITSAALLAGCATQSHTVTATDPAGTKTVTSDKSSQSDNAALSLIGSTVKIGSDIISAVLPPFIPVIVGGLTHPVTTAPAPANP